MVIFLASLQTAEDSGELSVPFTGYFCVCLELLSAPDQHNTKESIMKRVIVTGGAGFLGSHLCEKLLSAGSEVYGDPEGPIQRSAAR